MRNLRRPWTADEDALLRQLLEAGESTMDDERAGFDPAIWAVAVTLSGGN
jgi:hypothetical protein